MEPATHALATLAEALKLLLEAIALATVAVGLADSGRLAYRLLRERPASAFTDLRIRFGSWLAIALEFQLGADIVATTVRPSAQALLQLGLVALIRTFLNFFLGRELAEQARLRRELAEAESSAATARDGS